MADVLDDMHLGCTREMARLQAERDELRNYAQSLRTTLADVLPLLPEGEAKEWAKRVVAGEVVRG